MQSSTGRSHDRFATTRWSVVMRQAAETPDARNALGELAQRYWYPVYTYVRRCGHGAPIAEDIVRGFLQNLLREFRRNPADAPPGHYRQFLLERLQTFLARDWRESAEADTSEALELPTSLEARYQHDHVVPSAPEQAFQRSFALEVLSRALRRLRSEARDTGHLDMFTALESYLGRDPTPGTYEALGARLGTRPLALAIALKRLRQRLRELVGEELADTVTTADDLAVEQETLLAVLREQNQ